MTRSVLEIRFDTNKTLVNGDLSCRHYTTLARHTVSKSRGEYLSTHFKNMREVAAALNGKHAIDEGRDESRGDLPLKASRLLAVSQV